MSVSELESYILRGDIEAGERLLLTNANHKQRLDGIARELLGVSYPHYVEDAIQEAREHTIRQIRRYGFISQLFRDTFAQHGGRCIYKNSICEILEIPPLMLELAAQQLLEQPTCGSFCFSPEFMPPDQEAVRLLSCNHPLHQIVIKLALGDNGVCSQTLDEFYTWHETAARTRMLDCRRRYNRQNNRRRGGLVSLDQTADDETSLLESFVAPQSRTPEEFVDRQLIQEQLIRCLEELDRLHPSERYLDFYREHYLNDKTQKQIAEEWGMTEGGISKRHKRLLEKLKGQLLERTVDRPPQPVRPVNVAKSRQRSQKGYE